MLTDREKASIDLARQQTLIFGKQWPAKVAKGIALRAYREKRGSMQEIKAAVVAYFGAA